MPRKRHTAEEIIGKLREVEMVVSRIFRIFGAAADPVKRFGW